MMHKISILGSTGSVGTSTLKVVDEFKNDFEVMGLAAGSNTDVLADQIKKFSPKIVSIKSENILSELKSKLGNTKLPEIYFGVEGAKQVASIPEVTTVMSSIVGSAGLLPTLAAIEAGKNIGLANKESMVVAGAYVSKKAREKNVKILPVDSEHSAIFQSLAGAPMKQVRRLILTASGGPFYLKKELDLSTVKKEQALKHPNWSMGSKITIDSATLMNKGLEVIEAKWLFDTPISKIDVVIHPQSIVHSMVEYVDGSIIAQIGDHDMVGPIAYAMGYPDRLNGVLPSLSLEKMQNLNFYKPDHERFPAISLARESIEMGETFPAVLNGANEATVEAFLQDRIGFTDIVDINKRVLHSYQQTSASSLEDYLAADQWGRDQAKTWIEKI